MNGQPSPFRLLNSLFTNSPFHLKFILLVLLMGMGILIASLLGILLAMPVFSLSWEEIRMMAESGFEGGGMALLKYFQAVQSVGLFIIPAILANLLLFSSGTGIFNKQKNRYFFLITGLIFLTIILAAPLINQLVYLNSSLRFPESLSGLEQKLGEMEQERAALTDKILAGTGVADLLINLLVVALLPALGEEFLFRGVLQKLLGDWISNQHLAILITAMIFSAFHLQFYGFLPRMILGLYFGYLLYWSGNIWFPVVAHLINNATAVLMIHLSQNNTGILQNWLGDEYINQLLPLLLSTGITFLLVWNTKRLALRRGVESVYF